MEVWGQCSQKFQNVTIKSVHFCTFGPAEVNPRHSVPIISKYVVSLKTTLETHSSFTMGYVGNDDDDKWWLWNDVLKHAMNWINCKLTVIINCVTQQQCSNEQNIATTAYNRQIIMFELLANSATNRSKCVLFVNSFHRGQLHKCCLPFMVIKWWVGHKAHVRVQNVFTHMGVFCTNHGSSWIQGIQVWKCLVVAVDNFTSIGQWTRSARPWIMNSEAKESGEVKHIDVQIHQFSEVQNVTFGKEVASWWWNQSWPWLLKFLRFHSKSYLHFSNKPVQHVIACSLLIIPT